MLEVINRARANPTAEGTRLGIDIKEGLTTTEQALVVVKPPLPVPDAGTRGQKVEAMTQSLAYELEKIISEEPRQWHLVVPNWPSDREV